MLERGVQGIDGNFVIVVKVEMRGGIREDERGGDLFDVALELEIGQDGKSGK